MESNYDKVMRIGKEIIIRLDAKSLEMAAKENQFNDGI